MGRPGLSGFAMRPSAADVRAAPVRGLSCREWTLARVGCFAGAWGRSGLSKRSKSGRARVCCCWHCFGSASEGEGLGGGRRDLSANDRRFERGASEASGRLPYFDQHQRPGCQVAPRLTCSGNFGPPIMLAAEAASRSRSIAGVARGMQRRRSGGIAERCVLLPSRWSSWSLHLAART
jgi:hypothetical protein